MFMDAKPLLFETHNISLKIIIKLVTHSNITTSKKKGVTRFLSEGKPMTTLFSTQHFPEGSNFRSQCMKRIVYRVIILNLKKLEKYYLTRTGNPLLTGACITP
jgi:hypothetical protein